MKIGVMLGRLSNKYNQPLQSFPIRSWEEEFDNAARIGFDCIEWVEDGLSDKQNPFFDYKGRKNLKNIQKLKKITINSICAHSFITGGLISPIQVERMYWVDRLRFIIDCSIDLGIEHIIIPLMDASSINSAEKENLLFKSFSEIEAIPSGLKILFETDLSAKDSLNFLNKINRRDIGLAYDLGNSTQLNHNLYSDILSLNPFIGEVHLKDKDSSNSFRLGLGKTDFKAAAKALKECDWQGSFILETPIFNNWEQEANSNFLFAQGLISSIKSS